MSACDSSQQTAVGDVAKIEFSQHENQKLFGNYTIHVNTLTTDQLPSEVAHEYKIARSKNKAMLNVVITENNNGIDKPITGTVNTVARNLANQIKDMEMREIIEQDAIYYIGIISVDNEEIIIFDIEATPANGSKPFLMTYRQQFITE
jgi:hypothetical protein